METCSSTPSKYQQSKYRRIWGPFGFAYPKSTELAPLSKSVAILDTASSCPTSGSQSTSDVSWWWSRAHFQRFRYMETRGRSKTTDIVQQQRLAFCPQKRRFFAYGECQWYSIRDSPTLPIQPSVWGPDFICTKGHDILFRFTKVIRVSWCETIASSGPIW